MLVFIDLSLSLSPNKGSNGRAEYNGILKKDSSLSQNLHIIHEVKKIVNQPKARFCPHCGAENNKLAKSCPTCGLSIDTDKPIGEEDKKKPETHNLPQELLPIPRWLQSLNNDAVVENSEEVIVKLQDIYDQLKRLKGPDHPLLQQISEWLKRLRRS